MVHKRQQQDIYMDVDICTCEGQNMHSASFCTNIGVDQMQVYNLFLSVNDKKNGLK